MEFNGIQGKTLVVTGAGSGMGLLLAQEFARLGGNVVMGDLRPEELQKEADAINAASEM